MRFRSVVLVLLVAPFATLGAQGSASHGLDMSIGIRTGLLGFGPEVAKLVTPHIGLRAGVNFFSFSKSIDQSDVSFSAKIKMKAVTGLVDFFPGNRGTFHLSAGVMTNPVSITGTGQPKGDGNFDINDHSYTSAEVGTLTGTAKWGSTLPYLGFGFGTAANSHAGLKFISDIGVGVGKPTITLTSTNANSDANLKSDLDAQVAKTQADVNKYAKVFPVISVGLVYRF